MIRAMALLILLGTCAGCSSIAAPNPVGVGAGINQMQKSPCACMEVPMKFPSGVVVQRG